MKTDIYTEFILTVIAFGLWVKLQSNLMSVQERYPGSSIKVSFLRYESDVQCALKCKHLTTFWTTVGTTMRAAWSRQCGIQLENAHAV